ncbi:MAG: serine/threonine protein kinase [Deltaproteobacteria bacterium]|nr:serine/threonine protein kinase [Deltaproteobacteria bacterium]
MRDRTGDVLDGKYRLVRLLGAGGMGSVYEAEHLLIGKRLAVKFLHAEFAESSEAVRRFQQEARAAAAAGHRGIVDIHDLGCAPDGAPYLVMELLDGESLGELLARERPISVSLAAAVAIGALSALAAAHRKGIVHRDIKPDNIFLERTLDDRPLVKLLDFGVSKMSSMGVTAMTRAGVALGTPHYMAPEQARGSSDLDARVDIYAMGVILYEALTGVVPFDAPNYNALMVRVITDEPQRPREKRADLPETLEALILRAIAKKPEDRFRRAEDMIEALLPFSEGSEHVPGIARRGTPSRPAFTPPQVDVVAPTIATGEGVAPNEAATGATISSEVAAFPAAATISSEIAAAQASPAPAISRSGDTLTPQSWSKDAPEVPVGKNRLALVAVGAVLVVAVGVGGIWLSSGGDAPVVEARWSPPVPAVPEATWGAGRQGAQGTGGTAATAPGAQTPSAPGAGHAGAAAGPAASGAGATTPPDSVRIALEGLPPNARVFLDDARISEFPIPLARRDVLMKLRVEADGYAPFSQMVRPDQDRTVVVSMRRRPAGGRHGGGGGVFRDTSEFDR